MKKAPLTVKHQARRTRALERLTVRERRKDEDPAAYNAYVVRKNFERDTLRARLGLGL